MIDFDLHPGIIHVGNGVVARWPGVVVVIEDQEGTRAVVEKLFTNLGADPDASDVVRAVRELTVDQPTLASVAYLMAANGGPMAMAHGDMEIVVDGEILINGSGGPNEVQIAIGDRLTLRTSNKTEGIEPQPPFDLRRGVAPGVGITLAGAELGASTGLTVPPPLPSAHRPNSGEDIEPPSQPAAAVAPFQSVLLFRLDEETAEPRQPLPVAQPRSALDVPTAPPEPEIGPSGHPAPSHRGDAPAQPGIGANDGDVVVHGIVCSRDHFNNPAAAFCMVCGISMVHVTHNLVPGIRPTLGFVVFDDGSTFGLDRCYIVGREPGEIADPQVAALTIQDNNETLSRRHAEIRLIDWAVYIVDLHSTNGTFIWDLNLERWNQISPEVPVALSPGDTVALGRRTLVYESVTGL